MILSREPLHHIVIPAHDTPAAELFEEVHTFRSIQNYPTRYI